MDQLQQKKINKKIGKMFVIMKVATLWGETKSTIITFKEYDPISLQIKGGILHFSTPNPPLPQCFPWEVIIEPVVELHAASLNCTVQCGVESTEDQSCVSRCCVVSGRGTSTEK
jgi:hypothetical protein